MFEDSLGRRYVVVGSAFNRQLKLFRCDKWDCIQTVSFESSKNPSLLSAQQSGRYLIMTEILGKALYVLGLDPTDKYETKLFTKVQKFVLSEPISSFNINTITSTDIPNFKMSIMDDVQWINFDKLNETSAIPMQSGIVVIQPSSLDDNSDRYTCEKLTCYHPLTCLMAKVVALKDRYIIRILNKEKSAQRDVKHFGDEITDIAFSKTEIPLLASIDIHGRLSVYMVNISKNEIGWELIVTVDADLLFDPTLNSVLMWCSRKDADLIGEEEYTTKSLLLVLHGTTFEILHIDTIEIELSTLAQAENIEFEPTIDRDVLEGMSRRFQENRFNNCLPDNLWSDVFLPYLVYTAPGDDSIITRLVINNDLKALAVAYRDGRLRLFTLNSRNPSGLNFEKCLTPFNGGAVGSILFLEDCREDSNIDSLSRYFVVGSKFNRQIKVFRFGSPDCIQTVSFEPLSRPSLLSVRQSGRNLIMTESGGKVFYILGFDSIENNEPKLLTKIQRFVLNESNSSIDMPQEEFSITHLEDPLPPAVGREGTKVVNKTTVLKHVSLPTDIDGSGN